MMSSILVIKVKCGDTQRRFSAGVVENERLDLSMAKLREKIRTLFSLGVDGDDDDGFTLTYTDIDGDTVTLAEDCDLDDVVFQGLNPVRMVVNFKTGNKVGLCHVGSGQSRKIQNVRAGVEQMVKNVPESVASQGSQTFSEQGSNARTGGIEGEITSVSKCNENAQWRDEERLADEVWKVKAKATDFGVYGVPDTYSAPPLPSEFLTTTAASKARSNNTGKGNSLFSRSVEDELSKLDYLFNECPFSGTMVDAKFHPFRKETGYPVPQFEGSHSQFVPEGPVFHTGVQCDICGVQPITGPRFISKVRYNYDLCSVCYQKSERKAEYVRIDKPMMYREVLKTFHNGQEIGGYGHKFSAPEPYKPVPDPYVLVPIKPVPLINRVKLNSRFISDVNVMDGTVMAPSVCFTKIWRMKNTGNVVWPIGTQLVWVNGKKFSDALSVDLEIPADGLPVDSELDIAVDFVAPELPGEYVSYWRMSSPSGQEFGHRIWVVIQVDRSHDQLSDGFSKLNLNLNLNLPPQNNGVKDLVADLSVEPSMNSFFSPNSSSSAVAVSSKPIDQHSNIVAEAVVELYAEVLDEDKKHLVSKKPASQTMELASSVPNLNFPSNDILLPVASLAACPLVGSFDRDREVETLPTNASSNAETLVPLPQLENFSETMEHEELSEMRINQAELNTEILKTMDSHLEQAQDFLCGIFGWDRILDELEKMGFSDKQKNSELVLKNKGSIKRVVMDLVAGEKSR